MMDRQLKKQIREMTAKLIYEDKKKKEFLSAKSDFNFLQSLIDKSNENQNLVITVKTRDGTVIEIRQKYQNPTNAYGYDGEPGAEELLEIK